MSAVPFIVEIIGLFLLVFYLLHQYSDLRRHNVIALVATFIAWYFSFMIVFLLPMDISLSVIPLVLPCTTPWSLVSADAFKVLWRIIYWSSQALTWFILPFMQSFSQSGEFTLAGKVRGALIANAIYYGTYMAIFGVLLVYVAVKHQIDGQKLKVIGITASNTWGLFLLVLLLGYGLVAVPRSIWYRSTTALHLKQVYFKLAKLHTEKCDAEESLEDVLAEIKTIAEKIKYNHPLRNCVDLIVKKCPDSFRANLRRNVEDYSDYGDNQRDDTPNERALVALHSRLIKSLHVSNRTINQWEMTIEEALFVEDVLVNEDNTNRSFVATLPVKYNWLCEKLRHPKLEWLYYCLLKKYSLRALSAALTVLTVAVIWSEMTFFNKSPVLSLFAVFLGHSRQSYNYLAIELMGILTIAYLCFCAYYAIFKMRIFNFYYLTPNHQTNEYSLIFSGTLVCRLTSPLCYNFLGLVHLDSHITKNEKIVETQFTSIMGHMDVISFISDGFNIYFPMLIFILCLATFFNLGGHVLHFFGFEQFIGDAEVTQDLIDDGKNLVKREKRRIQRNDPEVQLRHRDVSERLRNNYSTSSRRRAPSGDEDAAAAVGTAASTVGGSGGIYAAAAQSEQSTSSRLGNAAASISSVGFKAARSLKSMLPSLLGRPNGHADLKTSVHEYRDIPPYSDQPDVRRVGATSAGVYDYDNLDEDDEVDRRFLASANRAAVSSEREVVYESTTRSDELFKASLGRKTNNIRAIFDDV